MSRSPRRAGTGPLLALVAWTTYVWSTRIANAANDTTASAGSKAFSIGLSLTFVAFAVAGLVVLVRSWARPLRSVEAGVLKAFAAWTVVVWAVRVPMILADGHSVGFKAVHAVLGLISVGLAVWVWRTARPLAASTSGPASGSADQESLGAGSPG
jgi:hypothetical protein